MGQQIVEEWDLHLPRLCRKSGYFIMRMSVSQSCANARSSCLNNDFRFSHMFLLTIRGHVYNLAPIFVSSFICLLIFFYPNLTLFYDTTHHTKVFLFGSWYDYTWMVNHPYVPLQFVYFMEDTLITSEMHKHIFDWSSYITFFPFILLAGVLVTITKRRNSPFVFIPSNKDESSVKDLLDASETVITMGKDDKPLTRLRPTRQTLSNRLSTSAKIEFGLLEHNDVNRKQVRAYIVKRIRLQYPDMRLTHMLEVVNEALELTFVATQEHDITPLRLLCTDTVTKLMCEYQTMKKAAINCGLFVASNTD